MTLLLRCMGLTVLCAVLSLVACLLGGAVAYRFQGPELARELVLSYAFKFNGVIIAGVAFGLVLFVRTTGKTFLQQILSLVAIPEEDLPRLVCWQRDGTSFVRNGRIAVPVLLIGAVILIACGYPLEGFAKFYLALCSISVYYAGGYVIAYTVYMARILAYLEENRHRIKLRSDSSPMVQDSIELFVTIVVLAGLVGLYLAFRGTLTANFVSAGDGSIMRTLLGFPIVCFTPWLFFGGIYPRYALNKIREAEVYSRVSDIDEALSLIRNGKEDALVTQLDRQKDLLEIRQKLLEQTDQRPLLGLKDSPSLLVTTAVIVHYVIQNDAVVSSYVRGLIGG